MPPRGLITSLFVVATAVLRRSSVWTVIEILAVGAETVVMADVAGEIGLVTTVVAVAT